MFRKFLNNGVTSNSTKETTTVENKGKRNDAKNLLEIKKNFQKALQYYENEEWVNAMEALVDVLEIDEYYAEAQFLMGKIYEVGVEDSLQDAIKWYKAAVANGHESAQEALSDVFKKYRIDVLKLDEQIKQTTIPSVSFRKKNN